MLIEINHGKLPLTKNYLSWKIGMRVSYKMDTVNYVRVFINNELFNYYYLPKLLKNTNFKTPCPSEGWKGEKENYSFGNYIIKVQILN